MSKSKEEKKKEARQWGQIPGQPGLKYEIWRTALILEASTAAEVVEVVPDFETGEVSERRRIAWKVGEKRVLQQGVNGLDELYYLVLACRRDSFFVVWAINTKYQERSAVSWQIGEGGAWIAEAEICDDFKFCMTSEKVSYYQFFERYMFLPISQMSEKDFYKELDSASKFLHETIE